MLLKDTQAPQYMREDSITSGYRQKLSYKACITSWFSIHNETVNIWSHFIGFLIFVYCLALILWNPPREIQSFLELIPLIVQLVSYMVCMLSSTLFHTFSCHSETAHKKWRYTDHFGILFALFGTYVSFICSTFSCFTFWKRLHLSVVVTLFIWVVLVNCLVKKVDCRIPLDIFIGMAGYSVIPIAHWIYLEGGFHSMPVQDKLQQIIVPFVAGLGGLVFYVTRFPEKLCKAGSVDILGASHQVWHILIFLGMAAWYKETRQSFANEETLSCPFQDPLSNSTVLSWLGSIPNLYGGLLLGFSQN